MNSTLLVNNSQHCWMLRVVACCWQLLCKAWNWSKFWANNSQHFFCSVSWSLKWNATMLDPFAQLFQHCRGHAYALPCHGLQSRKGCILLSMDCMSQRCCMHLHTTANTDTTTCNFVGPAMLTVVVSVCT